MKKLLLIGASVVLFTGCLAPATSGMMGAPTVSVVVSQGTKDGDVAGTNTSTVTVTIEDGGTDAKIGYNKSPESVEKPDTLSVGE